MGQPSNLVATNERGIVLVTQGCYDPSFEPLGIVISSGEWLDNNLERLASLIQKLVEIAPEEQPTCSM